MYAFLWRHLPGPTPVKVIEALALLVLVFLLLMHVVFPALEPHLPLDEVTVGQGSPT
ncbi:hypothetical protein [Nocardioides alcanivorans]|uniref:hypothetical protein n=1 Tax=Nocardioides alcanivorans TaxID=2897352 RepID=UPI001F355973|nr:hypothetical protein [Nocardioides alcanivorans]